MSLIAWQVAMYGFMAVATVLRFERGVGARLETGTVKFWCMMQTAVRRRGHASGLASLRLDP